MPAFAEGPMFPPTLDTIFTGAVAIPDPVARSAYLDQECGADAGLRERAEAPVAAHFRAGHFIEEPGLIDSTAGFDDRNSGLESIGERIGPYRLLERIGEGGMGVVYVAEQTDPVKRRVALK